MNHNTPTAVAKHIKKRKQMQTPADVDKFPTHQWLSSLGIKAEPKGFIFATPD